MESPKLSVMKAAAVAGVHPNTIRNAIKRGELEAKLELGRFAREEYRIGMPELQDWANRRGIAFAPENVDRLTGQALPDREALLRRVVQLEEQMATIDPEKVKSRVVV